MKKTNTTLYSLVHMGLILTILGMIIFPLIYVNFLKTLYINNVFLISQSSAFKVGLLCFYTLAFPYLSIIFYLDKIAKLFKNNDFFNKVLSKYLSKIANLFLFIAILIPLLNLFLYIGFNVYFYAFTFFSSIIFPFVSIVLFFIFSFTSKFYLKILEIKEENDLTV